VPLSLERGRVTAVLERHEGLARIEVDRYPCVAYPSLTGPIALGDEVIVLDAGRIVAHGPASKVLWDSSLATHGVRPPEGVSIRRSLESAGLGPRVPVADLEALDA